MILFRKTYKLSILLIVIFGLIAPVSQISAQVLMSFSELGSDVVGTFSGSCDTTDLNLDNNYLPFGAYLNANGDGYGLFMLGGNSIGYSGVISSSWTGGIVGGDPITLNVSSLLPNSTMGDFVGLSTGSEESYIFLPESYVSLTELSGTSTWSNIDFQSLGLSSGQTHTYSWGEGSSQSMIITVVPESKTYALIFSLFALGYFLRKERSA